MTNEQTTIEEVEKYILTNQESIKFLDSSFKRGTDSLKQFILRMISKFNSSRSKTVTATDGKIDCKAVNRSIGDIFMLARYYDSSIKLEQVYEVICELLQERVVGSWICSDIGKRVYWVQAPYLTSIPGGNYPCYFNSEPIDEYLTVLPNDLIASITSYGCDKKRNSLKIIEI